MEQMSDHELAGLTVRSCEHCGGPIPKRRTDARFCSTSHRVMASRKRKREREVRESLVTRGLTDQSLAELHDRARPPQHWSDDPRVFSDYGDVPGDVELAAEIDEQDKHFHALVQADADRTPRETWKRWRAHGRRYGTEHPAQTADRIERHRAAEAARMARIDQGTAGRIQDRFDARTSGNLAANANASRRLNARYTDQPPVMGRGFDFTGESFDGGPYRSGRPAGQRRTSSDYAWRMEDGFRF
jgi:hypothetical protein